MLSDDMAHAHAALQLIANASVQAGAPNLLITVGHPSPITVVLPSVQAGALNLLINLTDTNATAQRALSTEAAADGVHRLLCLAGNGPLVMGGTPPPLIVVYPLPSASPATGRSSKGPSWRGPRWPPRAS